MNDPLEHEADRVSEQVMRMPASGSPAISRDDGATVQHACAACEAEEVAMRKAGPGGATGIGAGSPGLAPPGVAAVLATSGRPLDAAARSFFEPRFGRNLGDVRIHTDSGADSASRSIGARAFTVADHIAFAGGEYAPLTAAGRKLLGHELTHVLQQSGDQATVRRDVVDDAKKKLQELEQAAEAAGAKKLVDLGNEPVGPPSGFTGDPRCGPTFCQPFASKAAAAANLAWAGPLMLAGIAAKVNTRLVPLWASYLSGGSAPRNLTADFGKDFTASPTTARTTQFLIAALASDIAANQTTLLGGTSPATIDFTPRLGAALAAIDDPAGFNQMNFSVPKDIAGNLAGGIGKDETAFPIGAQPSPFNDSRSATVSATLTRNVGGSLTVTPRVSFTVMDTIDLCPGDCGAPAELVATIPLSRFEATGLSGDVPFTVQFDAPLIELAPFTVAAAPPPPPVATPVPGSTTASVLNIRAAPDNASKVVGSYSAGSAIIARCRTTGTVVDGVDTWYQIDKGYVSGRYVSLAGGAAPPLCGGGP